MPKHRKHSGRRRTKHPLQPLLEPAGAPLEPLLKPNFWEKLGGYAQKLAKTTRAPILNIVMGGPITVVDSLSILVNFLCGEILACMKSPETLIGGGTCSDAAFFAKEALDDLETV